MAGGYTNLQCPYELFVRSVALKLPTYDKVEQINYIMDETTTFAQLESKLDIPEFRSYALTHSLCCSHNTDLFKQIFESNFFNPSDDYVIFKSVQRYTSAYIRILLDYGFRFDTINPFYLWVKDFELNPDIIRSDDKTIWRASCIQIFDMLIESGYDIHLEDDLAFRHCTDLPMLEYFVSRGCQINGNGEQWLRNYFINFACYPPYAALKYMLEQGLDVDTGNGLLVEHAFRIMDGNLIKFLHDSGYDFKPREERLMRLFGAEFPCGCDYSRIHETFVVMILHGFDLNGLRSNVVSAVIGGSYVEALEVLISGGFDLKLMLNKWELLKKDSKIKMFKLLIKNGLEVEQVVCLI
jgi:hypothetical protein